MADLGRSFLGLILGGGGGRTVTVKSGPPLLPGDTYRTVIERLVASAAVPPSTSAPESLPSPDPEPLPPLSPSPIAPPLPTLPDVIGPVALGYPPPFSPGFEGLVRAARGKKVRDPDDQAYGRLRMGKARRMARRRGTMRAQTVFDTPIDPRSLPVPREQVITQEDFERATDEEVRRRARERGDVRRPAPSNEIPPTRRTPSGRRVGVGVGAVLDPFGLAEDVGAILGGVVGEVQQAVPPEEQERRVAAERELRRRQLEEAQPLPGETNGRVDFGIPPMRAGGGLSFPAQRPFGMAPMPTIPRSQQTVPARRSRAQRALNAISRMTSNPWAIAGVIGLGVLDARKRSPAAGLSFGSDDDVQGGVDVPAADDPGFTVADFPFSGGVPMTPTAASSAHCDCKPKKRGPKRRCLERGTVAWRSGRYKGKAAGTKCIRWQ